MRYSECFYSLQGEGRYVGVPSVFLRLFGCNLRCPHFSAHNRVGENPEVSVIIKEMDKYKTFEELPLVKTGCDSYSSVYPPFKRFAKDAEPVDLAQLVEQQFSHTGETHLVITGGEPLLAGNQKDLVKLLHALPQNISRVTFETNGTQVLRNEFIAELGELIKIHGYEITFSVSPKLSSSGEDMSVTIIPDNIAQYQSLVGPDNIYLKFVVTSEQDIQDLYDSVAQYREAGFRGNVYLMPAGGCVEEYNANRLRVSKLCLDHGYRYSPRLHVDLYGNSWGT